mgnify:CR=1 FL=1
MNKKWNPSNWQGRSKSQVENGYKLTGIILTAFAIGMVIGIFYGIGNRLYLCLGCRCSRMALSYNFSV